MFGLMQEPPKPPPPQNEGDMLDVIFDNLEKSVGADSTIRPPPPKKGVDLLDIVFESFQSSMRGTPHNRRRSHVQPKTHQDDMLDVVFGSLENTMGVVSNLQSSLSSREQPEEADPIESAWDTLYYALDPEAKKRKEERERREEEMRKLQQRDFLDTMFETVETKACGPLPGLAW